MGKINNDEFYKGIEKIKQKGAYGEVHLVIDENNNEHVLSHVEFTKTTGLTVLSMCQALEEIRGKLAGKYPELLVMDLFGLLEKTKKFLARESDITVDMEGLLKQMEENEDE